MFETKKYLEKINPRRLEDNLWELVQIPSPTGHERQAALHFAQMLERTGAKVEVDESLSDSPNVIGYLDGNRSGPVLQLAGHLDHINIAHEKPKKEDGKISGRGSADMKNGLAGILEILHILKQSGCDFPGRILVTAYGLHEAPDGNSEGLFNLIKRGIKGNSAIVFEGPSDAVTIMANGMAIWNLAIRHPQSSCHEFSAGPDASGLLDAMAGCIQVFRQEHVSLQRSTKTYPLLTGESLFVGQVHYGDFYNRQPDVCTLQGTRRWHPDKTFQAIGEDFSSLLKTIKLPDRITLEHNWQLVGESYEISPDEKIVQSLLRAYQTVLNKNIPVKGHSSVTDVCRLVREGKIPAVLCGFGTETGHADKEFVTVEQMVVSSRVAMLTVLDYLCGK